MILEHILKVLQHPTHIIEDPFRVLVFDNFLPKVFFDKLWISTREYDGEGEYVASDPSQWDLNQVDLLMRTLNNGNVYEIFMDKFNLDSSKYTNNRVVGHGESIPPGKPVGIHLDTYSSVISCIFYVTPVEVNEILGTRLYTSPNQDISDAVQIVWKPNRLVMLSRWQNDMPETTKQVGQLTWHSGGWDIDSNSYRGTVVFQLCNNISRDKKLIKSKLFSDE